MQWQTPVPLQTTSFSTPQSAKAQEWWQLEYPRWVSCRPTLSALDQKGWLRKDSGSGSWKCAWKCAWPSGRLCRCWSLPPCRTKPWRSLAQQKWFQRTLASGKAAQTRHKQDHSVVVSENRQKHEQCPYNKNDKTSPILCASRNELWTYPVIESPPLLYSTQSRAKPHFLSWSPNNLREAQTLQHAPSPSLSLRRSAGPRCVCLLVSQHTQLRSVTGRFLCLSISHLCQRHPHLLHPVACSGITTTRLAFPSQLRTVSVTKPHKPHKQLLNQFLLSVFKAASVAQETSLSHFIRCNRLSATLPVAPLTFSQCFPHCSQSNP